MKKILAMLLALVMVLSLAACASTQPAAEPAASSDPPRAERPTPSVSASSCSMRRSMPQRRASSTH